MKFRIFGKGAMLVLAGGLAAGGCGEEDTADSSVDEYSITADTSTGYSTELPAPVTPVPDTGGNVTVVGELAEVNNSGAGGAITLTAADSGAELRVRVSDVEPNTSVSVGIYRGDCAGVPGEAIVAPASIPVNELGIATGTVTIPVPPLALQEGLHAVHVYTENAGPPTPPVACAELPDRDP